MMHRIGCCTLNMLTIMTTQSCAAVMSEKPFPYTLKFFFSLKLVINHVQAEESLKNWDRNFPMETVTVSLADSPSPSSGQENQKTYVYSPQDGDKISKVACIRIEWILTSVCRLPRLGYHHWIVVCYVTLNRRISRNLRLSFEKGISDMQPTC